MGKQEPKRQKLPHCLSQYLEQLNRRIRYRRKISREIITEIVDHFEEALQNSDPSQDRERVAQDLISEFGEVETLARLMRRAKKRCRPLWQKALIRSFQAGALILGVLICYAVLFFHSEPTIRKDYLAIMNEASRPKPLDVDNAWPHYQKAAELFKKPTDRINEIMRRDLRCQRSPGSCVQPVGKGQRVAGGISDGRTGGGVEVLDGIGGAGW